MLNTTTSKSQEFGSTKVRVMLHLQYFHNNFVTNLMWQVVTNSNLGQILKLLFYSPITPYRIRFFVKILWMLHYFEHCFGPLNILLNKN